MKKLTDMQLVLLAAAADRDTGSLLPPPENLGASSLRIHKAVSTLIDLCLAAEIVVEDRACSWRDDGDTLYGVAITDAGRERIGVPANLASLGPVGEPEAGATPRPTKSATVIELMSRGEGASLTEMVEATGWLPHTTRAALTGLRKKGHAIVRDGERGATRYRIDAA